MNKNHQNLIWIDLEMTGLDTFKDRIIEIATIVTDKDLNIIEEGPVIAINTPTEAIEGMDDWNTNQHNKSGLVKRIESSTYTYIDAQEMTIEFLLKYVDHNKSPMCGSGICQDRRFLARCMPDLENFFHYRNFDVSTIKEIAKRWYPSVKFRKDPQHLALQDIKDSIEELKYYKDTIFLDIT
ncbi:MAG: oligoribonuclease [Gammaproteobacteria bacterium]|jgi:oligoribonuclease|nr:oligoribonuclease [Gammaproteobacteria bacterium]MBT6755536.1 oligoribonuclease [Gammaproteobacteria bacterium]MBT7523480.1 oligoribonuclease [Gammaproteobacteria bacterium]MBT7814738.1 oligoribonuclease [Gammaproteobacteria bacterium]MDC3386679.1 oligoribonuclease [Gammaproteobacteria bacterium]|tara:strand:- start:1153 stop:1698 length:546 start_codon:yes stop_codon:yes gene_type:complete